MGNDDFAEVQAELSPEGVLTLNGARTQTMTIDMTKAGASIAQPKKSEPGRPFCLTISRAGAKAKPVIVDAVGATEQQRWLDAAHHFAADGSTVHRLYTFSVEICDLKVQEITVRYRTARAFHTELVEQGHCRGLKFPAKKIDAMRD
eukprot:COSAG02_NODE_37653_length_439_cov_0.752941_1_plen_146_part_11